MRAPTFPRLGFAALLVVATVTVVAFVRPSSAAGETVSVGVTAVEPGLSRGLGIDTSGFSADELVAIAVLQQNGVECVDAESCGMLSLESTWPTLTPLYNHSATYEGGRIGFSGPSSDVLFALNAIQWTAPLALTSQVDLYVTVLQKPSDPTIFYEPFQDHYYQFVEWPTAQSWTDARTDALLREYEGLNGYLANITTQSENDFIANYTSASNVWFGAADGGIVAGTEGDWYWADGPEAGTLFYQVTGCPTTWIWSASDAPSSCIGLAGAPGVGSSGSFTWDGTNYTVTRVGGLDTDYTPGSSAAFSAWVGGEPNEYVSYNNTHDAGGFPLTPELLRGEDAAVTNWQGGSGNWNDLNIDNRDLTVTNWLVEYGGICTLCGSDLSQKATTQVTLKLTQTITFDGIADQTDTFDISLFPTASSGYVVDVTSDTPSVCTVAGSTVTKISEGLCVLTANQGGDSFYESASTSQSFTFAATPPPASDIPQITWQFNDRLQNAPATVGNATCTSGSATSDLFSDFAAITFTAPASGNGTCTWTPPTGVTTAEVFLVGGGGGGGFDAGGGGGGGALAYHSAFDISGESTITVGGGGAGSTSGASYAAKIGAAGNASAFSNDGRTLTAGGGGGGRGCFWNGYICTTSGSGNTGGSGGTSSSGTQHFAGANGGNGVFTTNSGGCSSRSCPTPGGSGNTWNIVGITTTYGGGGGGSGASFTPGAGGFGGGASGTSGGGTPLAGEASTGGGGAGGNGGAGSNGGSGIVVIRFALNDAFNSTAVSVTPNFSGLDPIADNGTLVRQYASLTDSTCGSSWTTEASDITTFPDETALTRGRCYRWTFDSGISESSVLPNTTNNANPSSNLTSPVVYVPNEATVNVPEFIPVERTKTSVIFPLRIASGSPAQVLVCVYPTLDSSLVGEGVPDFTGLTFDLGSNSASDTSTGAATVNGDRTPALEIAGSLTDINSAVGNILATTAAGTYSENRYVLVRVVPLLTNFESSCDPLSPTAKMTVIPSGAGFATLRPMNRTNRNRTTVTIG